MLYCLVSSVLKEYIFECLQWNQQFFRGGGGGDFFWLESYYSCELGAHVKFQNPKKPPFGRMSYVIKREEE